MIDEIENSFYYMSVNESKVVYDSNFKISITKIDDNVIKLSLLSHGVSIFSSTVPYTRDNIQSYLLLVLSKLKSIKIEIDNMFDIILT